MSRTLDKWYRLYLDGYDLSGYSRSIGPFGVEHEEANMTTWTDTVNTYLKNRTDVKLGTYNAIFDNTATSGLHALTSAAGVQRNVLLAMGFGAAPVAGDPCFGGQFLQGAYQATTEGGAVTVTIPFNGWSGSSSSLQYGLGFGKLLHANSAETGGNSSIAPAALDNGAASFAGGYMMYQVLTSSNATHTATIFVEHSTSNEDGAFVDLDDATTGVIVVKAGVSGIVAIPPDSRVNQFLRWQIALGTATSVTFVLSFHRG